MQSCNVQEMFKNDYDDPCFFVDFHNLGRGLIGKNINNPKLPHIIRTKDLNCWKIVDNRLQQVTTGKGILFDAETYLIQWVFEFYVDETVTEETLFYYWKGGNASKGFSPLPPEIENQNPIVNRICQWSEPALFFHIFPKNLIVFNGKHEHFDPNMKRLFMVRGELQSEVHLYEVPCKGENLRSRGIFLLIEPSISTIFYWYGRAVPSEYQALIQNNINLEEYEDHWKTFKKTHLKKENENDIFHKLIASDNGSYFRIERITLFTPRLFYFNSITGMFLATEIEYPLRSKKHVAAFPFLQSHLYSADQPALFLLDNDHEIWLWEGCGIEEQKSESFNTELKLAKETAVNYANEKQKSKDGIAVPIRHVVAGSEPVEFTNIFPYWTKNDSMN